MDTLGPLRFKRVHLGSMCVSAGPRLAPPDQIECVRYRSIKAARATTPLPDYSGYHWPAEDPPARFETFSFMPIMAQ